MISEKEIHEMPLDQKVRVMEAIWEDIRRSGADFPSPVWHGEELAKTERRRKAGLEEPMDWDIAKEKLRKRENES
jgi:hypothetical protein